MRPMKLSPYCKNLNGVETFHICSTILLRSRSGHTTAMLFFDNG